LGEDKDLKKKVILISYSIICVLILMLMLAKENIFIIAAIALGFVMIGHREIWSLIKYHRMPVIDERVKDNLNGAMRLTGFFFFIASIILILLMRFNVLRDTSKEALISGQLLLVGLVYILSYYYYDRVQPNIGERSMHWVKVCLVTAGVSIGTAAISIVLHNLIGALFDFEEAVFFILGVLVAPGVFVLSILGLVILYVKGLFGSAGHGEPL
jgi:hypothetical protein